MKKTFLSLLFICVVCISTSLAQNELEDANSSGGDCNTCKNARIVMRPQGLVCILIGNQCIR